MPRGVRSDTGTRVFTMLTRSYSYSRELEEVFSTIQKLPNGSKKELHPLRVTHRGWKLGGGVQSSLRYLVSTADSSTNCSESALTTQMGPHTVLHMDDSSALWRLATEKC